MNKRLPAGVLLSAVTLAAAVLPGVAVAAPADPDSVRLEAVGERSSESGRMDGLTFRPGRITRDPIGVRNRGATVDGVVVQLTSTTDDLVFARRYDNCWYALDGRPDSAWCEFDSKVAASSYFQLAGPVLAATGDAQPSTPSPDRPYLKVRWSSKAWADAAGGVEALANEDAAAGTTAVRGDDGTLTLEPASPRLSASYSDSTGTIFPVWFEKPADGPWGAPDVLPPSDPDGAALDAVQERTVAGERPKLHHIAPGDTLPGTVGVRNTGATPVKGLLVELRLADDDLVFARRYDNCWYALEAKPDSAWCAFDRELAAGETLRLAAPVAIALRQRYGDLDKDLRFHWVSAGWAEGHGGARDLAELSATPGTTVVRGTGGTLTLSAGSSALKPGVTGAVDYLLALVPPSGPEPTTPPATPPATAAPGGGGGSLPITGTPTATLAGAGALLLLAGVGGFWVARRRRTRFQA
ncbi:hypothetical protein Asp14428_33730 [Actinoplanes sp. NBRC 14428]|nr:hypothetical protein Asp14428_33730 [Actinoplanes sp. NBRC 14428]